MYRDDFLHAILYIHQSIALRCLFSFWEQPPKGWPWQKGPQFSHFQNSLMIQSISSLPFMLLTLTLSSTLFTHLVGGLLLTWGASTSLPYAVHTVLCNLHIQHSIHKFRRLQHISYTISTTPNLTAFAFTPSRHPSSSSYTLCSRNSFPLHLFWTVVPNSMSMPLMHSLHDCFICHYCECDYFYPLWRF